MHLPEILHSELAALQNSSDCVEQAYAHNLTFETRVSAARLTEYHNAMTSHLSSRGRTLPLHARHQRYIDTHIYGRTQLAATFQAANSGAHLDLTSNTLATMKLLRVEDLHWPLSQMRGPAEGNDTAFKRLHGAFMQYKNGTGDNKERARQILRGMLARWNKERDGRPIFATLFDSAPIAEALTASDRFTRLRDLLGLGHLTPTPDNDGPVYVALLVYPVGKVLAALNKKPSHNDNRPTQHGLPAGVIEKRCAFAAPTALDTPFSQWFFPVPADPTRPNASYGHTVDLNCGAEGVLPAEVLHAPLPTAPSHLYAVGRIDAALPTHGLAKLRNTHLNRLRQLVYAKSFGELMAET
jgi:hypothetical protein